MMSAMEILASAGPWTYPLGAMALCLVGSVVRAATVIRSDTPVPAAGPPHHAVVVWGILAGVVGLLGTVLGVARLIEGAQTIAGSDAPDLAAILDVLRRGAIVTASPVALGLALFAASLVAWLGLGFALNRRVSDGSH